MTHPTGRAGNRRATLDGMDESTGIGGDITDDNEFQAAQDGEFPVDPSRAEVVPDDDERPVGHAADDDVVGIDEERRVPLPDERVPTDED